MCKCVPARTSISFPTKASRNNLANNPSQTVIIIQICIFPWIAGDVQCASIEHVYLAQAYSMRCALLSHGQLCFSSFFRLLKCVVYARLYQAVYTLINNINEINENENIFVCIFVTFYFKKNIFFCCVF